VKYIACIRGGGANEKPFDEKLEEANKLVLGNSKLEVGIYKLVGIVKAPTPIYTPIEDETTQIDGWGER
jgi:hypothetical protein